MIGASVGIGVSVGGTAVAVGKGVVVGRSDGSEVPSRWPIPSPISSESIGASVGCCGTAVLPGVDVGGSGSGVNVGGSSLMAVGSSATVASAATVGTSESGICSGVWQLVRAIRLINVAAEKRIGYFDIRGRV